MEAEKKDSLYDTLKKDGYSHIKEIPERGVCSLFRFIYTTGLVIGCTETGYKGRYCYSSFVDAKSALAEWDGTGHPPGEWIKYKGEGGELSRKDV
jgi:hypothetical protein